MSHKYAEKLIILCDQATGIQCRLYQLVEFKRPALFARDSELDRFARLFVRKFPEFPDSLSKEKGADVFKKRSPEVTTALNDYYCTFLEVVQFTDEAWKLITELAANVQELRLDINVDLLAYFLNLFTRYAQIHFLVKLIDTPEMFLAAFARAFHTTSGNSEPNFLRIAKYIATFRPNPLKKMQEDAASVSLCIGNTLMPFAMIIQRYSQLTGYTQGKLFNLLHDDTKNLTAPVNENVQLEAMQLANLRQWILYGFLLCPAELARPGAIEMLTACLRETFLLPIFRDKSLNIHKEFDELMDYKSANGNFKLSKHKKAFKDAGDDEATRKFHLELRTYLRSELDLALRLFEELPSCLPPKMSMVLALLSLARNEVVWFFRHQHFTPFRASSSRTKGLPYDPQIGELIDLVVRVSRIIDARRKDIQAYYIEFLTQLDARKAAESSAAFLQSLHNPNLSNLVHAMVDHLAERKIGDNLESIRLNWYRISAAITHSASGIPIHSTAAFSALMNRIVHHSRNIDLIDTQLKTHASFSLLWWYKEDVFESLKECLRSSDGSARHCGAYVSLLNNALHNIHRLCPDEQPAVGKEVVTTGDAFVRTIVHTLERCVQSVINETAALRQRTNHSAVLAKLAHVNQMASNPSLPPLLAPGEESKYDNRRLVANLAASHKILSDICSSVTYFDRLVLYNIEFVPREYVHEAIGNLLRGAIVQLVVQGPMIAKPTLLLSRVRDILYALGSVERALAINVHELAREVLLSEFAPSAEAAAAAQNANDPNRHAPVILNIASYYAQVFSQDLAGMGIVYSSIRRCFVSRRGGVSTSQLEFERFTDVNELRALATLVGPAGVGVIDRALIKVLARAAKQVKEVLIGNSGTLTNMSGRFTEQSVWLENVGSLTGLDQLCAATTTIGCILHFRTLLRDALREVTHERSHYVQQAVELAYRAVHEAGVVVDPKMHALDNAAAEVGIEVGEADHAVRLALAPLKTTVADMNLLALLPELFGVMYLSSRWRQTSFSIEIEGHLNNAHCMAAAVRQLLVQFQRIVVKEGAAALEIERRISADLERFVRCSAFSILHMKQLNARERDTSAHYPLHTIMIFLEQCIEAFSGRVEMSTLESCFPYTLLRTNFIQEYEKQTKIHAFAPVADEAGD